MTKTISAFIRVANEKNTILSCLASIKDIFDEYIIGYNNNSRDGSIDLIKKYIKDLSLKNYYLYHYDYKVIPAFSDQYKNRNYNNNESLASYYNFVLSKIKTDMFAKIDCDQVYFHDILRSKINKFKKSSALICGSVGYNTGVCDNHLLDFASADEPLKGIEGDHFMVKSNSEITFVQKEYWEQIWIPKHYYYSRYIDKEPIFFHFKRYPASHKRTNKLSINKEAYNKYVLPLFKQYNSPYQNLIL